NVGAHPRQLQRHFRSRDTHQRERSRSHLPELFQAGARAIRPTPNAAHITAVIRLGFTTLSTAFTAWAKPRVFSPSRKWNT
ncbi:MAG: hypothetical protein IH806_09845, partial [Proteobacteria bacterium]|nr:hypothetical protein [Pseudomonadota bacterium]